MRRMEDHEILEKIENVLVNLLKWRETLNKQLEESQNMETIGYLMDQHYLREWKNEIDFHNIKAYMNAVGLNHDNLKLTEDKADLSGVEEKLKKKALQRINNNPNLKKKMSQK